MQKQIINEQEICTWQEFVHLKKDVINSTQMLYRGLPNPPRKSKKENWKPYDLKTTYQRRYQSPDISNFYHKLEDFQKHQNKYFTLKKIRDIGDKNNLISLVLYLRHVGIPMPVLDVTYNPLTALYFSVYNLYDQYGVVDSFDSINKLNECGYVSIIEFNIDILENYYNVIELDAINNFQEIIDDRIFFIKNFDELPFENKNMNLQDGAFIFLSSSKSIDLILRKQESRSLESLPTPIIHYRISYSSIFDDNSKENIYSYLERKGKIGHNMFCDDQALLFDFLNPSFNI